MYKFVDRKPERRKRTSAANRTDFVTKPHGDRVLVIKNRRRKARRAPSIMYDNYGNELL